MKIELRLATQADLQQINQLANRIWWAHYPEILSPEQIKQMLETIYSEEAMRSQMAEGQVFRLVFVDDEPIGYVATTALGEGRYFLNKFYLEKTRQGGGIGTAVLTKMLETMPDLREMRLNVNRRNFRSINFYFKNGFVIDKFIDTPFGSGFILDDYQMVRRSQP